MYNRPALEAAEEIEELVARNSPQPCNEDDQGQAEPAVPGCYPGGYEDGLPFEDRAREDSRVAEAGDEVRAGRMSPISCLALRRG